MKLYMKQKMFSLRGDFAIYDANQVPIYKVEGKLMALARQLRLLDGETGEELAFVKQQLFTLMPKMFVFFQGEQIAAISKKFTFLKPSYEISEIGWSIEGDYWAHDYTIYDANGQVVADLNKKMFSWSDTFEINIVQEDIEPAMVVAVVLAIDAVMDASNNS